MIRVLVVDDDFRVAAIHAGFVERTEGFELVGVAHTGAEAAAAVAAQQPDLALLDVYLPDTTGIELIPRFRSACPNIDVLVISAAREAETVRQALRGGAVQYLIKPFTYADLAERLAQYRQGIQALSSVSSETDQAAVDKLFGVAKGPSAGVALPKGYTASTLAAVADALAALSESAGDASAAEVAERLGMSRVSARRYLEYLVSTDAARARPRYGDVGRPQVRYQTT